MLSPRWGERMSVFCRTFQFTPSFPHPVSPRLAMSIENYSASGTRERTFCIGFRSRHQTDRRTEFWPIVEDVKKTDGVCVYIVTKKQNIREFPKWINLIHISHISIKLILKLRN